MEKKKRLIQLDADLKKISRSSRVTRDSRDEKNKKNNFILAFSFNVGYYLLTPLILGVIVGLIIDNKFRTKPWFTLIFILFGLLASLYNLLRITKEVK